MVKPALSGRLYSATACGGLFPLSVGESEVYILLLLLIGVISLDLVQQNNVVATAFQLYRSCLNFKTLWSFRGINENTSFFYISPAFFSHFLLHFRPFKNNSVSSTYKLSASILRYPA